MKLLILGGSSFIAKNFLEENDFSGYNVTATYHSDKDFPSFAKNLNKRIKVLKYDFLNDKKNFSSFDTCLYFAGNSNHTWSYEHKKEDLTLNTIGLLNFLETFHGRLIYMSSGAVYLGQKGLVKPGSKVSPSFPYAISKISSEYYLNSAYEEGKIASFTCIRFYYAFGPYEEGRRLIPRLFHTFTTEGSNEVTINGDGRTLMQPVFVFDVAKSLFQVVKGDKGSLTVDLCSKKPIRLKDFIRVVALVCDTEVVLKYRKTTEKKIEFYSSPHRFEKLFGSRKNFELRTALKKYFDWWEHGKS